jgi:hypothetical protein
MDTRHYDKKMAANRSFTGMLIAGAIVVAALLGLVYSLSPSEQPRSAANPPAVMTYPAPTTGAPAPAETTTGQQVPRPSDQ